MQNNSLSLPDFNNKSPIKWYQEASKLENFIHDDAQKKAIMELSKLWEQINNFLNKNFFKQLFAKNLFPKGVYMWGGVGRGKSFIMDAFFNCLSIKEKKRIHFHPFMLEIHNRMRELKETKDPLVSVAKELSKEIKVLCFDEFHVSDIADAMILGNLLTNLIKNQVVIVMTSNYHPNDLYPDGLNRSSFLSTIELIRNNFNILNVDGGEDYRLRTLVKAQISYVPSTLENLQKLRNLFFSLVNDKEKKENEIEILGHKLKVIEHYNELIWFDFDTLFVTKRSQQDYLVLAKKYSYVFISGIRKLSASDKDIARRFTWLIDIFYDYKVKICFTSDVNIDEMYVEGDFAEEFSRTASRVTEMQSKYYLNSPHQLLKK